MGSALIDFLIHHQGVAYLCGARLIRAGSALVNLREE
jgi:hypothetical protein